MRTIQICSVVLAVVGTISCGVVAKDKRGLLDLGYGYSGSVHNGGILGSSHGNGHGLILNDIGLGDGYGHGYGGGIGGGFGGGGIGGGLGLGGLGIGGGNVGTYSSSVSTVNRAVPVAVPQPYPVTVTRPVPYAVAQHVSVDVPRAVPVDVPQPYPVTVTRTIPVDVPRAVAVPVAQHVPISVPHPVPVSVNRYPTQVVVSDLQVAHGGLGSSYGHGLGGGGVIVSDLGGRGYGGYGSHGSFGGYGGHGSGGLDHGVINAGHGHTTIW